MSREDAYRVVQKNAMETWHEGGSYLDRLKADEDIAGVLTASQLDKLFDLDQHFGKVDMIFNRVFG